MSDIIAAIPGDRIGIEVLAATRPVLDRELPTSSPGEPRTRRPLGSHAVRDLEEPAVATATRDAVTAQLADERAPQTPDLDGTTGTTAVTDDLLD